MTINALLYVIYIMLEGSNLASTITVNNSSVGKNGLRKDGLLKEADNGVKIQKAPAEITEKYPVNGTNVDVNYVTYVPDKEGLDINQSNAIFIFGGWETSETGPVSSYCRSFANESDQDAFAIRAQSDEVSPRSAEQRAEAVRQFVVEHKITNLTLVGHSHGGLEATNLVALLQETNPEVKINGLILIDTVGLYNQSTINLIIEMLEDGMVKTPLSLANNILHHKELPKAVLDSPSDMQEGIKRDIHHLGLEEAFKQFKQDVEDMRIQNPNLAKIRAPVIFMQGAKDPVSDYRHLVPNEPRERKIDQDHGGVYDPWEEHIRETLVPNASLVKLFIAHTEKGGHHALPYFRPEVAKSSLYTLKRNERNQQQTDGISDPAKAA